MHTEGKQGINTFHFVYKSRFYFKTHLKSLDDLKCENLKFNKYI